MLAFLDTIPYGSPRLRRVAFWLLTGFVCYSLLGFFAVPPILKGVLTDQLAQGLKRPTRIEKIYFNPYILHLEIDGLEVSKRTGEGNLVAANTITVSPSLSSIWHFAPVIAYLHLDGLTVDITFHGNNSYSFSDLMDETATPLSPEAPAAEEEKGAVFPFALYGFEMTNATIIFDDRARDKRHVITDMVLRVPFTSSIEGREKEFTQPKFTAVVNGDPVELKGRTLPFDKTMLTEFELGAVEIDLGQYWRYVPIKTPLKLKKGHFTSDISLFFERPDANSLKLFLGGGGTLADLELEAPGDGSVLKLAELGFELDRFSLGDNALDLTKVTIKRPYFKIIRSNDGSINWAGYLPPADAKQKEETGSAAPFLANISALEIKDGTIDWIDDAVAGGYSRTFGNLAFSGADITTYGDKPGSFQASIGMEETIAVSGTATIEPLSTTATITANGIHLPAFAPYINQSQPMLVDSGICSMEATVALTMTDGKPDLRITDGTATLANLVGRKPDAKDPSLTLVALDIVGASLDLRTESVTVDQVVVTEPAATLIREKDGTIDVLALFTPAEKTAPEPETETVAPRTWAGGWNLLVTAFTVESGALTFKDRVPTNAASLGINALKLDLKNISTEKDATSPYTMSGAWTGRGTFSTTGTASIEPLRADGTFRLTNFGLRPFDAYLAEHTELLIAKGAAHANLKYAYNHGETPQITVTGDTALTNVQAKTTFTGEEFAGIDRLDIKSIAFKNDPNELTIGEIILDGPRALVEYADDGRLNIRRALRMPEPPPVPEEGAEANTSTPDAKSTEADIPADTEADTEPPLFTRLDIGKVIMANGTLRYKDASVHPVFSNTITEMQLSLTEIGQTDESRPEMNFKAKIGPTPMSVSGVLNPVITPIYSDLVISVNGMELVPLSPYTIKNLAYPIEKGRLYADVTFKTAHGELDAQNKFFIEQLVLGPKDKRPDAPSVPVKFGLALLQDGNGDMELNLPISGRLDDPNFRIGGIVFKAIVSLFFKALASPFSLIGSIFGGGGADMDFVVFEPGRFQLDQAGEEKMATIIKALTERDKLKLEVDGVIDPTADVTGLTNVIFTRKIKTQKYDSLSRKKRAEATVDDMVITPEEYAEFLFEAYADEPDEDDVRPTTLFMVDEQPVEVMEKFIRDRIIITDELLHELAMQRANAIKSYIIERNPALTERVFLLDREDAKGKTGVPAHRADLGIN